MSSQACIPLILTLLYTTSGQQLNVSMGPQGAEEMGQMEHLLNVYASKAAKNSIADFVGYIEVATEQATTKLTQGVWLVSAFDSICTLVRTIIPAVIQ